MKSKEEIEELAAREYWNSNTESRSFIKGYTQCQKDMTDKRYTKEDLENAFNSGKGYGVPDNIKDFNSFINSLNKQD